MEKYIVSARKYRPSSFKTIVGQHALAATLKNAVKTGRLAHSYLFCGQRGVGKTTTARIFAKAINCEHLTPDGEPCNECESCRAFNEQRSLNIIEMDAASNNSVDDIREITSQVLVPPISGKYRVFIIDEVHMLSSAAFNAFLKTHEEPPEYVIFILATTEKNKILPTILSRCQKYDFQSITTEDIAEQLQYVADQEGYKTEPAGLSIIAQKSDGAMRDALSIFDQVAASSNGNITYQNVIDNLNILDYDYYFRLVDAFLSVNIEESLLVYKDVREHGFEGKSFINGLANHIRELLMAHSPKLAVMLNATADIAERFKEQSARCKLQFIYAALDLCNTCDLNYRDATNKQLLVELTLIKICQLNDTTTAPSPQPGNGLKKIETSQTAPQAATQQAAPPANNVQQSAPGRVATANTSSNALNALNDAMKPKGTAHYTPIATKQAKEKKVIAIPSLNTAVQQTQIVNTTANQTARRSEHYFFDDFKHTWEAFMANNPHERILLSAMRAQMPQDLGDCKYELTLDNQVQMEAFERCKRDLTTFFRDRLKNDGITFTATIREISADEKVWSQKDLLLDIVERHPQGIDFIKKFQLSLP